MPAGAEPAVRQGAVREFLVREGNAPPENGRSRRDPRRELPVVVTAGWNRIGSRWFSAYPLWISLEVQGVALMKKILAFALAAGVAVTAFSPALAADGCGRGFHRGPGGHCRPDRGRDVVAIAPGLVIGNFYGGRGYWDGHRYWQHRDRWHNGWRYR
jgi:hypothetical protein